MKIEDLGGMKIEGTTSYLASPHRRINANSPVVVVLRLYSFRFISLFSSVHDLNIRISYSAANAKSVSLTECGAVDKSWSELFISGEGEDGDSGILPPPNGREEEILARTLVMLKDLGRPLLYSEKQKLDWADLFFLTTLPESGSPPCISYLQGH
ncbi:hypothetical protein HYC85_018845 [Camellia sinensis]|uniref:Uncharacterized protein n=1 Tax=Camellia sinensis TaxID=4442 RepID=A0A7J7GZB0_CAMSI|nr:hypothetical protein HYC85_018845 [Camellia sinensis]